MKTTLRPAQSLAKVLESRYWKEEDARQILAAWARTGESARSFARRYGLSPARILRWKARLSTRVRPPVFHPVKVVASAGHDGVEASTGATGALELIVSGRCRIVVRRGFDAEVLAELLQVVESWGC